MRCACVPLPSRRLHPQEPSRTLGFRFAKTLGVNEFHPVHTRNRRIVGSDRHTHRRGPDNFVLYPFLQSEKRKVRIGIGPRSIDSTGPSRRHHRCVVRLRCGSYWKGRNDGLNCYRKYRYPCLHRRFRRLAIFRLFEEEAYC